MAVKYVLKDSPCKIVSSAPSVSVPSPIETPLPVQNVEPDDKTSKYDRNAAHKAYMKGYMKDYMREWRKKHPKKKKSGPTNGTST